MMKPHLERGAKGADSPRGAAQGAELILTSLPGPPEVEAVALGEHGIIRGAAQGAIYADLSTGSPRVMRKIHAAFRAKGMHVLDAPVYVMVSLEVNAAGVAAVPGKTLPVLARALIIVPAP